MMQHLKGKTALITGASRGIGKAVAELFVSHGANVGLISRSEQSLSQLASTLGDQALALPCDVADHTQVQAAVKQLMAHFETVDFCINNAGLIDPIHRIEDSDPALWGHVLDVNVKGVYNTMHAVYPHLVTDGGVIVNLSSGAATNALEGWSHYCASKAAVLSLTKCGHKEWFDQNITVVGLSPGTVATEMQRQIKDSGINAVSQLDWSAHITPEEAAQAVAWLCSEEARGLSGTDFSIKTPEGRAKAGLKPRN